MGDAVMDKRGLELGVGLFLLVGLACLAYLSFHLGHVRFFGSRDYEVHARFASVAGLKPKSLVTMAGVNIGDVKRVQLKDGQAEVTLRINRDVRLEEDVIASIKTMGVIGDKYVSISPGASDHYIEPGGVIRDTQPPLDIESLLGRFIFGSMNQGSKEP